MLTKRGTWTTRPVSNVAGLLPPEAVSPLTPGSVCFTSRSILGLRRTFIGLSSMFWMSTSVPSIK